ncbi:MAG: M48 family metalloprotease [Candidatus Binatia bacterium]
MVMRFNTQQDVFPANLIAGNFGFQHAGALRRRGGRSGGAAGGPVAEIGAVNFAEQQRRNQQRTVLLIAAFLALFAAVGLLLDLAVVGAPLPIATVGALAVAGTTSVSAGAAAPIGCWRRCSPSCCATTTPSTASWPTSPARWPSPPACRARVSSSSPIRRPTRSPPVRRRATPPSPSPPARWRCSIARRPRASSPTRWHIANRDSAVMTLVSVLFGGLLMLADWARRSVFFARQDSRAVSPLALVLLPLLILLTPLLSQLLAMAVSRRREYQADATAVQLTRNPEGLARALEKIAASEFPLRAATRGSAHLFIVSPLRRRRDDGNDGWASLFATHPPLAQRIALLRGAAE